MEIGEIREWLRAKGIMKSEDLSEWDNNGNWKRWKLPRIPQQIKNKFAILIDAISYFAPVHIDEEDTWYWGKNREYTTNQGYYQLESKTM